jgi:hypothetical protein
MTSLTINVTGAQIGKELAQDEEALAEALFEISQFEVNDDFGEYLTHKERFDIRNLCLTIADRLSEGLVSVDHHFRKERILALEQALQSIVDAYDVRSEAYFSDTECAANMADRAEKALKDK